MSLRGYWRTLIVFIACNPAMRMTKLTTIARTGRLMKRSVNDFIAKVRSPKSEIRNKFEYRNSNSQTARLRLLWFEVYSFEHCFEFRHSCFGFSSGIDRLRIQLRFRRE